MNKYIASALFFIALLTCAYVYDYPTSIKQKPYSIHSWRQADCASIALNYYQFDLPFNKPEVHNQTANNGTTGNCLTSEIPILYYFVSKLYAIFTPNEMVYRITTMLIFFLGLFHLFRLANLIIKDQYWSALITLCIFTSPVLIFYGNSFLSNIPALSFSMMGWYYFYKYYGNQIKKYLIIATLLFGIAGALKITALLSPAAIFIVIIIDLFGFNKLKKDGKHIENKITLLALFSFVFTIIGWWIYYASSENAANQSSYFSTTTFPIWTLSLNEVNSVFDRIFHKWILLYFNELTWVIVGTAIVITTLNAKAIPKLLKSVIVVIAVEILIYAVLQFWTFKDHDYYTINLFILPMLILIAMFSVIRRQYREKLDSFWLKISATILLVLCVYLGKSKLDSVYNLTLHKIETKSMHTIRPYINEIGIKPSDKVIFIPDVSHVGLYLLNLKGWTQYTVTDFYTNESKNYNQDEKSIERCIKNGAKYLILEDVNQLTNFPYLVNYTTNLIGRHHEVLIFDLIDRTRNFDFNNPKLLDSMEFHSFNEDEIDKFQNSNVHIKYNDGVSLDVAHKFGFEIKFDTVHYTEQISISFKRKGAQGSVVSTTSENNIFYHNVTIKDSTDIDGWTKFHQFYLIPYEMHNRKLIMYFYNPGDKEIHFKDLNVERHRLTLPIE